MTSNQIISGWCENTLSKRQQNRVFPNVYLDSFEADILEITKAGYAYEYEVKVSRADFKKDFTKSTTHAFKKMLKSDILKIGKRVNYFSYVVPKGLIEADEVPEFAGLIYAEVGEFRETHRTTPRVYFNIIKNPTKLTSGKFSEKALLKCYESTYFRFHLNNLKQII